MILFRSDSSFTIGTGHIVRCLHLAGLLKQIGHEVQFLSQDLTGNITEQIRQAGFTVHLFSQIDEDVKIIQTLKPHWLVIDHYGIDENWQKQISSQKQSETKIFVIDDLMNRKHLCHVLLDQNYRRDFSPYRQLIPSTAKLLAGPQYCLMSEHLEKPLAPKKLGKNPQLISFFGGADSTGELLKLAKNLVQSNFQYDIRLVALKSHQHLDQLKSLKLPSRFDLKINPPNWHQLLADSDFYIGSGGTVTWERLYLGLPGAVIAIAENQQGPSQELAEDGYQLYWGSSQNFDYSKTADKIAHALSIPSSLQKMSEKGLQLVGNFNLKLAQEIFAR